MLAISDCVVATKLERGEIRKGSARGDLRRGGRIRVLARGFFPLSCGFPSHPKGRIDFWHIKNYLGAVYYYAIL